MSKYDDFLSAITSEDKGQVDEIWKGLEETEKLDFLTRNKCEAITLAINSNDKIALNIIRVKIRNLKQINEALKNKLSNLNTDKQGWQKTADITLNAFDANYNKTPTTEMAQQKKGTHTPRGNGSSAVKFIKKSHTPPKETKKSNTTTLNNKNEEFIQALKGRNQEAVQDILSKISTPRELLYLLFYNECDALKSALEGESINIALIDIANKIFASRETTTEINTTVNKLTNKAGETQNSFNLEILKTIQDNITSKHKIVIDSTIFSFLEAIHTNNASNIDEIWNRNTSPEQRIELLQDINYAATKIAMEQEFLTLVNVINKITSLGQVPEDFRTNLHAEIVNHETTTIIPPENQTSVEVLKTHLNNKNLSPTKKSTSPNTEKPQTSIQLLSSNSKKNGNQANLNK